MHGFNKRPGFGEADPFYGLRNDQVGPSTQQQQTSPSSLYGFGATSGQSKIQTTGVTRGKVSFEQGSSNWSPGQYIYFKRNYFNHSIQEPHQVTTHGRRVIPNPRTIPMANRAGSKVGRWALYSIDELGTTELNDLNFNVMRMWNDLLIYYSKIFNQLFFF